MSTIREIVDRKWPYAVPSVADALVTELEAAFAANPASALLERLADGRVKKAIVTCFPSAWVVDLSWSSSSLFQNRLRLSWSDGNRDLVGSQYGTPAELVAWIDERLRPKEPTLEEDVATVTEIIQWFTNHFPEEYFLRTRKDAKQAFSRIEARARKTEEKNHEP